VTTARAALESMAGRIAGLTETPRFEAELLLAHFLGWDRTQLIARLNEAVELHGLEALVRRRLASEPIAYILGTWEFYSMELAVEAPLLVPRPETEHLVEVALPHIPAEGGRVLDLCTGTGCVALALARHGKPETLWATDISPVAVRVATENARRHGLPIQVAPGDLFDALPEETDPFHVISANPPYVEAGEWPGLARDIRDYEDPGALLSGADGLDCIRRIVSEAPRWLCPGGLLALEMGEGQGRAVRDLLERRGFSHVAVTKDLAGHDRIAHGRWSQQGNGV